MSAAAPDDALARTLVAALAAVDANFPPPRLAMLFGSRARGHERTDSDVDLAVLAGRRLEGDEIVALVREIASRTGLAVDVVDLFDLPQPVSAEALGGRRLLGDDETFAATLVRNAIVYEDFGRLRERALARRRRRWLDA